VKKIRYRREGEKSALNPGGGSKVGCGDGAQKIPCKAGSHISDFGGERTGSARYYKSVIKKEIRRKTIVGGGVCRKMMARGEVGI